jgi:hypothetical protein
MDVRNTFLVESNPAVRWLRGATSEFDKTALNAVEYNTVERSGE